jgi:hypothetical protein
MEQQQTSLTDKLFWPMIVLAVLALGGIGTIVHKIVSRHSAPALVANAEPPHSQTLASVSSPETTAGKMNTESQTTGDAVPADPAPENSTEVAAAPAPAAAVMDDESPYVVPDRKPFISRETFAPPPKPAPPKKAVVKTPPPAVKSPLVPVKTAAATVAPPVDAKKSAPPPTTLMNKTPVYVMRDGRKIAAIKVVDLGDSYGLKSTNGQIITVLKEDVTEIQK